MISEKFSGEVFRVTCDVLPIDEGRFSKLTILFVVCERFMGLYVEVWMKNLLIFAQFLLFFTHFILYMIEKLQ